jgi:hypothetical protein
VIANAERDIFFPAFLLLKYSNPAPLVKKTKVKIANGMALMTNKNGKYLRETEKILSPVPPKLPKQCVK